LFSSLVTLFQIHKEAPAEYYNFFYHPLNW
jgi:hypothetical protein